MQQHKLPVCPHGDTPSSLVQLLAFRTLRSGSFFDGLLCILGQRTYAIIAATSARRALMRACTLRLKSLDDIIRADAKKCLGFIASYQKQQQVTIYTFSLLHLVTSIVGIRYCPCEAQYFRRGSPQFIFL